MKSTDYGTKNPLRCPECDTYRFLDFKGESFPEGNKAVEMKIPYFACKKCGSSVPIVTSPFWLIDEREKAETYYRDVAEFRLKDLKDGQRVSLINEYEGKIFEQYNTLGFKYDSRDYFIIPGLYRDWNEGKLCPVFFSKDLLLYYNSNANYKVKFASTSRFHIYNHSEEKLIRHGFGINRNGKIICWLGDLEEELKGEENEIHRNLFRTFNIDSDHDIISDYYINQIEANFITSDNETGIFYHRNELDKKVLELFGYEITQLELTNLIDEYKHPVTNESSQIEHSYIKLNSLLVESLNITVLKQCLRDSGIKSSELKGLRELKLFEKFVRHILKFENSSEIVSPLYVLYDLRLLAGHIKDSKYETKYKSCLSRLNLEEQTSGIEVQQHLCSRLKDMYELLRK